MYLNPMHKQIVEKSASVTYEFQRKTKKRCQKITVYLTGRLRSCREMDHEVN
jgi:hypothetical protein